MPLLALCLASVGATATLLDPATAASQGRNCGPRHAQTVRESATIRFYRVPHRSRYAPELEFACWRPGGDAPLLLGYAGSYGFNAAHTTVVKLADPAGTEPSSVIAWVQRIEGHVESQTLRSGDVRTGRLLHESGPTGKGYAVDIDRGLFAVSPTGSLGWFGHGGPIGRKGQYTGPNGIWTVDASGEHLIEATETLSERGLVWGGGSLYWIVEGQGHSTPLP